MVIDQVWTKVCHTSDIPIRGSRIVKTSDGCVALFKIANGDIYALDDQCPHKGGPLSQGIIHDASVTCPLHNWVISLKTGKAQGLDEGKAATKAIKVIDGYVHLLIDENGEACEH
jgi:nitrite reductase (NADH) small subunit